MLFNYYLWLMFSNYVLLKPKQRSFCSLSLIIHTTKEKLNAHGHLNAFLEQVLLSSLAGLNKD